MPTNRLWLEHTEGAAWDAVQSLRQQLERMHSRVQRLSPLNESWQGVCSALDEAATQLGIQNGQQRYAELARAIAERLQQLDDQRGALQARIEQLERELEEQRRRAATVEVVQLQASTATAQSGADAHRRSGSVEADGGVSNPVRWFAELVGRKHAALAQAGRSATASMDRLMDALELKCEELEQAPRREVVDRAAELAHWALRIALAAGQSGSSENAPTVSASATADDHPDDDLNDDLDEVESNRDVLRDDEEDAFDD